MVRENLVISFHLVNTFFTDISTSTMRPLHFLRTSGTNHPLTQRASHPRRRWPDIYYRQYTKPVAALDSPSRGIAYSELRVHSVVNSGSSWAIDWETLLCLILFMNRRNIYDQCQLNCLQLPCWLDRCVYYSDLMLPDTWLQVLGPLRLLKCHGLRFCFLLVWIKVVASYLFD